jgi:uncharacterized protein (DUF885 family)
VEDRAPPGARHAGGRREHNARWTDRSKAARDKDQYDLRESLQRAMWFSPGTLDARDAVSAYLLEADIRDQIESEPYLPGHRAGSRRPDGLHNPRVNVIDQMPPARGSTTRTSWRGAGAARLCRPGDSVRSRSRGRRVDAASRVVDLMLDQLAAQRGVPPLSRHCSRRSSAFRTHRSRRAQRRLRAARSTPTPAASAGVGPGSTPLRTTYRPRARAQAGLGSVPKGARPTRA